MKTMISSMPIVWPFSQEVKYKDLYMQYTYCMALLSGGEVQRPLYAVHLLYGPSPRRPSMKTIRRLSTKTIISSMSTVRPLSQEAKYEDH